MEKKPPYRGRVILTHGRSLQALVAARSLATQGIEVIGCDHTPMMALSFSKYVAETFLLPDAAQQPEQWLDVLQEEVFKRKPESPETPYVLMPLHRNIPLLAAARERFEGVIHIAAPDIAAISAVTPKDHLVHTCQEHGIRIPRTWLVATPEDIDAASEDDAFPKYVKLPDSAGGAGIQVVQTNAELRQACESMLTTHQLNAERPLLVQAAAEGEDYCFTGLFDRGRRIASMAYQNIKKFPVENGVGVLRQTVDDRPMRADAEQLMRTVQWHGVAELDFRWTGKPDAPPQLIEVNPRFWAGLFQSVSSGIDYPWLLYQQTIGDSVLVRDEEVQLGMQTRVPMLDWAATLMDWREDDPQAWEKLSEYWKNSDAIPTELISSDDRGAVLGALHVIGSLVRFGRLPEEFDSKDRSRPVNAKANAKPRVLLSFDRTPLHNIGLGNWFFKRLLGQAGARRRPLRYNELADVLTPEDARELIHSVDALLLSGGGDVDPRLYGSQEVARNVKPQRDRFELALIEQAIQQAKPILGVCRGCQLLNVARGGSLHKLSDRKSKRGLNHWPLCPHGVSVLPDSRIGRLVGQKRLPRVTSAHRQAIKQPGDGIRTVGRAADGVIEAIESHHGWCVGVQWHPEWVVFKDAGHRIVNGFVDAARRGRQRQD